MKPKNPKAQAPCPSLRIDTRQADDQLGGGQLVAASRRLAHYHLQPQLDEHEELHALRLEGGLRKFGDFYRV